MYKIFLSKSAINIFVKVQRYLKVFIKLNGIILFSISSIISNIYLTKLKSKYEDVYNNTDQISGVAIVISDKTEKEYTNSYIIKIKSGKYKNTKFILNLKKDKILGYGDLINVDGEYFKPSKAKNYKGFDYSNYLKSKKIYGTIKVSNVEILKNKKINPIFLIFNNMRNVIKNKVNELLPKDTSGLLIGILLGNKEGIDEETVKNFRNSNLSHVLAVSGMHTSYVILRH